MARGARGELTEGTKELKIALGDRDCSGRIGLHIVQYDAEKSALDRQAAAIAVIDKAQLPEFIHEVTHP